MSVASSPPGSLPSAPTDTTRGARREVHVATLRSATPAKTQKARKQRRTYTVKPGDTPSSIAEKTNVPLSQIQDLNPNLDDQTLSVGQKIKLRR